MLVSAGIEGQRGDVLHLRIGLARRFCARWRRDPRKQKRLWMYRRPAWRNSMRRHRQRFDARAANPGQGLPGFAAVFALVNTGVPRIAGIQTRVVMRGFLGIDQYRVEDTGSPARKRQQTPGCACIVGAKQQRVTRTSDQRAAILADQSRSLARCRRTDQPTSTRQSQEAWQPKALRDPGLVASPALLVALLITISKSDCLGYRADCRSY